MEKGYIYISTFFSPGERAVFRAIAEESDAPQIRLAPTFMELVYRPHGIEPLLFARKRLLVLSRMTNPAEPPRRDELLGLNYIAAALAESCEVAGRCMLQPRKRDCDKVIRHSHLSDCHPFTG